MRRVRAGIGVPSTRALGGVFPPSARTPRHNTSFSPLMRERSEESDATTHCSSTFFQGNRGPRNENSGPAAILVFCDRSCFCDRS